ncbi:hypothetical protein PV325_005588 [Microctonus aethiopoides]|nr:hypothetical protein PV325_005588 [Microctonus aethiopoides]
MSFNFAEISEQLNKAGDNDTSIGVSFSGKSLKLNSEEDAQEVCEAIKKCKRLDYLDLEGNTLGPDAAKAISEALAIHGSNLKRALWKDMFTGRMKTEIPKALEYLGSGLSTANAQLVELDLSDNAFGPIGVQGLAALLSSPTCYTLHELRLNNNGLGISGGKMLAKALLDCHANSSKESKPLALRVFIAGRNRLENEGATALAAVFEKIGTLEEVVMPQNGIYHQGVAALANGLSGNCSLRILNLNDNTVGPKGAIAIANVLPNFPALEYLNLGDCLLKTKGALSIADALEIEGNNTSLVEVNLTFNEIRTAAVLRLARAMADKTQLMSLQLDGNFFGDSGRKQLKEALTKSDRIDSLGTLDEDATDDEESDVDGESESENENDDDDDEDENQNNGVNEVTHVSPIVQKPIKSVDIKEFLKAPTGENFLLLPGDKMTQFSEHAKNLCGNDNSEYVENLLPIIMKVSALCGSGYGDVRIEAERLTDKLYSELFSYAMSNDEMSSVNNNLLINLGLLKSEDRSAGKIDWNLEGCFKALESVSQRNYFPSSTKSILKIFIERPMKPSRAKVIDPLLDAKNSLKNILDKSHNT